MSQIPGRGISNLDDRCAVCNETTLMEEMLSSSSLDRLHFCSNLYQECKENIHKIYQFVEVHTCLLSQLEEVFDQVFELFKTIGASEGVYEYTMRMSFLQYVESIKIIHRKVSMYLTLIEEKDESAIASTLKTISSIGSCGISYAAEHNESMNGNPEEHRVEGASFLQIEQGRIPVLRTDYDQLVENLENIHLNEMEQIKGLYSISEQYVMKNEEIIPHSLSNNSFDYEIAPVRSFANADDIEIRKYIPCNIPENNEFEKLEISKNLYEKQMVSNSINSKISFNGRQHRNGVEVDQRRFPNWECIKRNPQEQQRNLNFGYCVLGERYEDEQKREWNPMQGVSQKRQHESIQNQEFANKPSVSKNNNNQRIPIHKMRNSNENNDDYYYNNNIISYSVSNGNDRNRMSIRPKQNPLDLLNTVQRKQNAKVVTNKQNFDSNIKNMENKNCKVGIKKDTTTERESLLQEHSIQWDNGKKLYDFKGPIEKVSPKKNSNRKFQKKKKNQRNSNHNGKHGNFFYNRNKLVFNKNDILQRDGTCKQGKNGKYIVISKNILDRDNISNKKQIIFNNCKNSLPGPKGNLESESDDDMNDTLNLSELRENPNLPRAYFDLNRKYNS